MSFLDTLSAIRQQVSRDLEAGRDREQLRLEVLGRKGSLAQAFAVIPSLSGEERAQAGQQANQLKQELEGELSKSQSVETAERPDLSIPAADLAYGTIHPISAMIQEMTGIFRDLSFEVVEGDELISEKENFENLNLGKDHPARDAHKTFYITDNLVLRTQTTSVQVLEVAKRMKRNELPIRFVVPGKTYRRESDQTHSAMFHQMDAVMIDSQTTFTDLRGCLDYFAKRLFGDLVETRFRPHFFPFTEPSAEMDIRWKGAASGSGKQTGWLEFGGCGMIHPEVLRRAGINPKIYQGWAFGMSVERPIMIRHQIPDLRRLYENSLPFLNQFPELI